VISFIAMFAVINGALIQIIMASRVCYGMARQRWLPAILCRVSSLTRTPIVATVLVTLLVIVMALWLPIEQLARVTSFCLLIIFCLVNLSLWRIKSRDEEVEAGIFQVAKWIPVAGFVAAACLLAAEIAGRLFGIG